jgi:hypothetical protein
MEKTTWTHEEVKAYAEQVLGKNRELSERITVVHAPSSNKMVRWLQARTKGNQGAIQLKVVGLILALLMGAITACEATSAPEEALPTTTTVDVDTATANDKAICGSLVDGDYETWITFVADDAKLAILDGALVTALGDEDKAASIVVSSLSRCAEIGAL